MEDRVRGLVRVAGFTGASVLLVILATAPLGCGAPGGGPQDGGGQDSGAHDAGVRDAGPSDAGPGDAGASDAGAGDAGPNDAGIADAGSTDAGTPDAGTPDAGPSCDPACVTGAPHALSDCIDGTCIYTCEPGYQDGDGDWTRVSVPDPNGDGCELLCSYTNQGVEICDGKDDDCDGVVDDVLPGPNVPVWYHDADGDGHGTDHTGPDATAFACTQPAGYVASNDDCDDTDANVLPGAPETCDGKDDDCNGVVDSPNPTGQSTWYPDLDGDGHGSSTSGQGVTACTAPTGYGPDGDCDDTNPNVWKLWQLYPDQDADGFTQGGPMPYCGTDTLGPGSYPTSPSAQQDCDDLDPNVYPGAPEYCNGIDDNCNGQIDEPPTLGDPTWYADCDADGYAAANAETTISCQTPTASPASCANGGGTWTTRQPVNATTTDCLDTDGQVHPGQGGWFTTAIAGTAPPGGAWDYNCNGGTDSEYPTLGNSSCGTACTGTGWTTTTLPACGQSGAWVDCGYPNPYSTCTSTFSTRTQACH